MIDKGFLLNRNRILQLIKEKKLIENYIDLKAQLAPHGFDLTAAGLFEFDGPGRLDFSNKERWVPPGQQIAPRKKTKGDKFGWWNLRRGAYKVSTNEILNLPNDLIAIAFPRSSLLRMGGFTQNAVWDAGFRGRSEFILVIENRKGIKIKQNARITQLIFIPANKIDKGYDGIYQEERSKHGDKNRENKSGGA